MTDDPIEAVRERLSAFLRGDDSDTREPDDMRALTPAMPEPSEDEPLPRDRWGRVKAGMKVG